VVSSAQILDRGRLLLGVLLAAPLGALLVPGVSRPIDPRAAGGQWSMVAAAPNPIATVPPTPGDVLARLTDPAVTAAVAKAQKKRAGTEIGSDDDAGASGPDSGTQIPGLAPDATLAARLRTSQARNAAPAPAPAALAAPGPMPVGTPTISSYSVPPGATHVFPVEGGAVFSDDWGGARPGGKTHAGIDLFAATGTPIVAVSDAVLFKVGWNAVGGWRMWLRDRWGNEFYFAHLSAYSPAAREGATVRAGTVLGFVGNTGDAKGGPPQLHFEIHPSGGSAVPPFPYVSAWPRI
jgi:murein DD-endopeptidase MepM/ murein hydrolase activator NlpD